MSSNQSCCPTYDNCQWQNSRSCNAAVERVIPERLGEPSLVLCASHTHCCLHTMNTRACPLVAAMECCQGGSGIFLWTSILHPPAVPLLPSHPSHHPLPPPPPNGQPWPRWHSLVAQPHWLALQPAHKHDSWRSRQGGMCGVQPGTGV